MNKHINLTKLFLTLLLTAICITLEAQAPPAPNSEITPNAMSFLRYGEIPVSLYTGTPDISIPIDTVHSGKLELPISLSYHSGGVKVDEHPGWVGLGWNLQVGGCITREMRGTIDELAYKHNDGTYHPRGFASCFSGCRFNDDDLTAIDFKKLFHAWKNNEKSEDIQPITASLKNQSPSISDPSLASLLSYLIYKDGKHHHGFASCFSRYRFKHSDLTVVDPRGVFRTWLIKEEPKEVQPIMAALNDHSFFLNDSSLASFLSYLIYYDKHNCEHTWCGIADMRIYGYDTGPDKFRFNFGKYSGFFIMDFSGQWQVYCNYPMKIESHGTMHVPEIGGKEHLTEMSPFYRGFTLTVEDGIKYVFGNVSGADAVEYSMNFGDQDVSDWKVNTWYLVKIIHPNGDEIVFNYERGDYIASLSNGGSGMVRVWESLLGRESKDIYTPKYHGQLLSPVYLKEITGNDFNIHFNSSTSTEKSYSIDDYRLRYPWHHEESSSSTEKRLYYLHDAKDTKETDTVMLSKLKWRKLDVILIRNGSRTLKSIKFGYNNNPSQRLALQKLTVCGEVDYTKDIYRFYYNQLDKIPKYLSQTDDWGYAQNSTYSDELKEVNPDLLLYGSLKEIEYPTGGRTIFEYEPHQYKYKKPATEYGVCQEVPSQIAGGLRIKSILNIANDGTPINKKEYIYTNNYSPYKGSYQTNGIFDGRISHETGILYTEGKIGGDYYMIGSDKSITPTVNALGIHIGYPQVVEKNIDGSYSVSYFTSLLDEEYADEKWETAYGVEPRISNATKENYRGMLKKKEFFDTNGHCVNRMEIQHEPLNKIKNFFYVADYIRMGQDLIYGSIYKLYTYKLVEKSRTTWQYDGDRSTPLVTQHYYTYNDIGQLRSDSLVYMKNGKIQKEVSNYHYAWESNEDFKEKCFFSLIDNIVKMRNGSPYNIIRNNYSLYNNKFPYLSQVYISNGRGNFHNEYSCYSVDETGNPVCVKRKGIPYIYLWGADNSCPVAEIVNADFLSVENLLGFPLTAAPNHAYHIQKKIEELRQSLPSAAITSYTYIPHVGVTSITDPAGKKTYYGYDTFGLLNSVSDLHRNPVKSYTHSTYLAGKENEGLDVDSLITGDRFNRLHILGPQEISPDSTYHYMVDWTDMPYHYKWRVPDTDTSFVSLIPNEDEVVLKMHGGQARTTRLIVDVFRGDGKKICNQYKVIWPCQPKLDMWLEDWGNGPMIHVRSKDGSNLRFCHLYLNDQELYRYPINANLDKPNFYLLLNLSRNRYRDIYQITAMTGIGIETKSFTTSELFPND